MAHDGILAFLADRLRAPHEVLATEGLCYLLGRYPVARQALVILPPLPM